MKTYFAPELHVPNGTFNIDFYTKFGAKEHFCLRNDDGSIHVAELDRGWKKIVASIQAFNSIFRQAQKTPYNKHHPVKPVYS